MITWLIDQFTQIVSREGLSFLWKFVLAAVALIVFYYIITLISKKIEAKILGDTIQQNKYTQRTAHLIAQVVFIFLMVCALLVSLEIVGLNTALIIWWMAIAIWFAMETTMGNMIAGVILLGNPHLKVGNSVELLWSIKDRWQVEEFHIRYTVFRTLSKQRIIIPNSKLLHTPIQTKKTEPLIRWEIHISIARHYVLDDIKLLLEQCINSNIYVSHKEQTSIHIHGFNAQWYELVCYYFMSPTETNKTDFVVNGEIRHIISKTFAERNIPFSYPRKTIRVSP